MKATHRHLGDPNAEYHKNEVTGDIFFKSMAGDWFLSAYTFTGTFDKVSVKISTFKGNKQRRAV